MIRVPDWIGNRLGEFYLYFAATKAATFVLPTPITQWGRGRSIRRAACILRNRIF